MPIFEYECDDCGEDFEELVASADAADAMSCPRCRGGKVRRKFSTFSARADARGPALPLPAGGCGRCGDPNGPCGL